MLLNETNFYDFIKERERIRLRKAAGMPFPWTEDSVLREYKFTNVRREHDRTSAVLIENFYKKQGQNAHRHEILMNCATFRYFGTHEFATALGWQKTFDPDKIIQLAKQRKTNGERVFTGAYVITNCQIKGPKEEVVTNVFLQDLHDKMATILKVLKKDSWQETHAALQEVKGFGGTGFMAKETLLDTMYCSFWNNKVPKDYFDWTPIGPGARRGINRVAGLPVDTNLSEQKRLAIILQLTKVQDKYWHEEWGRLAPTDTQFALCEFDKWSRVLNNEGRPRSKYHYEKS